MSGKGVLQQDNYNLEGMLGDNTPPPVRLAPVPLSARPQKVNAGKKIAESAAAALRTTVAAVETAASAAAKSAAEAKASAVMAHQEAERASKYRPPGSCPVLSINEQRNRDEFLSPNECIPKKQVFLDLTNKNLESLKDFELAPTDKDRLKRLVEKYGTANIIWNTPGGMNYSLLQWVIDPYSVGNEINNEIISYLIKEGADTSYQGMNGNTALHYVAIHNMEEDTEGNANLDCIKLLLKCPKTDLLAKNNQNKTPRELLTDISDRGENSVGRQNKKHVEVENFLCSLEMNMTKRGGKGTRRIRKNKNKNKNKKSRKYTRRN